MSGDDKQAWPYGDSAVARLVRDFDWAATPLGPVDAWSERRRGLIEVMLSNPMPLCVLWGAEHIAVWNDAWLPLVGTRHPAAFGQPIREGLPEVWSWMRHLLQQVLEGESVQFEDVLAPFDPGGSTEAWFSLSYGPLRNETGEVLGVLVNAIDTTPRVRAMAALRAREELQTFLVNLGDAIRPLAEPAEIIAAASEALGRDLQVGRCGYGEVDATGELLSVDRDWTNGAMASARGVHRLEDFVRDAPDFDESAPPCVSLAVPLAKGGRVVATLYVQQAEPRRWTPSDQLLLREVGERTWAAIARARADKAVRASEERLQRMLNVPGVGVLTFDRAGVVLHANGVFLDMLGYSREEFEAAPLTWRDFTPEEYMEGCEGVLSQLLERGRCGPYEKEYFRKDGSRIWILLVAADLGDGTLVEYAIDISDRKRAEERAGALLSEATLGRARAESANHTKDEFLATLGHELRTPLAAILLWANALRTGAVPMTELTRALAAITDSAETQSRLIEDLLGLSRLAAGKMALVRSAVDVGDIARAALEMVKPAVTAKGLAMVCEIGADVGVAWLDGARVKQILWNLLTNAAKFTPAGGEVALRLRKQEGHLEIDVADTGEGIAAEFLPHVFERFRQADMGETRQHMGLGIGLALTKQLVELQGGTIEAKSAGLGHGAVFYVRLPWLEATGIDDPSSGETLLRDANANLVGLTVLLVEDDPYTREAMQWSLEGAGATIVPVASAAAALSAMDRAPVDVVVSDLGLPGISGFALIERIADDCRRKGRPFPPSCAVSAHARDVDRQRALDAGFDMHLAKPVTVERLVDAVADLRDLLRSERRRSLERA